MSKGRWVVEWVTSDGVRLRGKQQSYSAAVEEAGLGNRTDPHLNHRIVQVVSVYKRKSRKKVKA